MLINPDMYSSFSGHLPLYALIVLLVSTIILVIAYFHFYFPDNKEIKIDLDCKCLLCGMIFGTAIGILLGYYTNIYIGILAGVATAIFVYDLIKSYNSPIKIFASFNACFINVLLLIGFAFSGVNKFYAIITGSHQPLFSISLSNMIPGVGILLLVIGFGAIFSSRTATFNAIVKSYSEIRQMLKKHKLYSIALFLVALQAAYQAYTPIQNLLNSSFGLDFTAAAIISVIVSVTTFFAVFSLLKYKSSVNCCYLWKAIFLGASFLTGISTIPFYTQAFSIKFIFWSVLAIFSTYLWGIQFLSKKPLSLVELGKPCAITPGNVAFNGEAGLTQNPEKQMSF